MSRSIAFYAPLKSPNHATPSGDRTIGRGLMNALNQLGQVDLVSELRTRDGQGEIAVQADLIAKAKTEIARLIQKDSWDAWVTYHNYYKAPDLVGPAVCAALDIPYHIVEASRANKRLIGPWADFAARAEQASDAAHVIYYFTQRDYPSLRQAKPVGQELVHLKPFLDRAEPPPVTRPQNKNNLLAVGMFRHGDKTASFENLAAALTHVTCDWSLNIIGSGEAEAEIKNLFAQFGSRVTFLGELSARAVIEQMEHAAALVWPGVNEAFGMVYIEAQAVGIPVVAEDRQGVRDVVGPSSRLVEPQNATAFAAAIDQVLLQKTDASNHRAYVEKHHLRGAAVQVLRDTLKFKTRLQ